MSDWVLENLKETDSYLFFSKVDPRYPRLGDIIKKAVNKEQVSNADVVIIGIPDDTGIKNNKGRPGAAGAPTNVRKYFYKLTTGCFVQPLSKLTIVDAGDIIIESNIEKTHERVRQVIARITESGAIPLCIGGGHDFSHPCVAGIVGAYGLKKATLGLINIDAHLDVRDLTFGINSGTPHFRTLEMPGTPVNGKNFVEFGIQEHHNSPEHYKYVKEKLATVMSLYDIHRKGTEEEFNRALRIAGYGTSHICVTFDIDATRMADAPGASA
ncbi:formimidoylglutamase, partial [Candidatus Micrarchaeota archaeon]|nr:formimidoylglutamase [Candidatus Micrarchaeota archaeon]